MTDFETWLYDHKDHVFRYWVYKRMFTPYEQDSKFPDESRFECEECSFGLISEAIELPDGDVLIGFKPAFEPENSNVKDYIDYYKLSDIALACSPTDQAELMYKETYDG